MNKRKLWFLTKSLCLMVMMLINASSISAQNNCENVNGGFEEIAANCPNGNGNNICFPSAFNNSCLNGWRAAQGAPDVCAHPIGTAPPGGGEYYARMGTQYSGIPAGCKNEAIFTGMDLEVGKTYTLSFYHKTWSKAPLEPVSIKIYQTGEIDNVSATGFDPCSNLTIPPGSELIHSNSSFISDEWILESFCFTAIDYPKYGLLFVPEPLSSNSFAQLWVIDNVCVKEVESCQAVRSLTSCPDEGDYGYIIYDDCFGDFNWEFPTGSTAQEITSFGFSAVLNASPGIYNVTITNDANCSVEKSWEIFDTCCDDTVPCPAPTGLYCEQTQKGLTLFWDAVPNIQHYIVTIFAFDPNCECDDSQVPYQFSMPAYTNQIAFDNSDIYCFSWVVSTICTDASSSEPSDPLCFNYLFQDCFEPGN